MPNWKKLVVSGSAAHLNSLNVNTFVSASDFQGGNFIGDGSQLNDVEGITKFLVTVENRGQGNKYIIDDQYAPELTLFPGDTYVFDLSDSSNSNHPLAFRLPNDTSYTYNVTQSGTAGTAGAETRINVDYATSGSLKYYCTVHGNGMGNLVTVFNAFDAILTGSFNGDGSQLTNVTASYLSNELTASISGSITAFSSSISGRVELLEVTGSDHESRLDTLEGKTLVSSSAQTDRTWIVGANGSSDYTFSGSGLTGTENDPTLYLTRGEIYRFDIQLGGAHPFRIQSTPNGSTGTQYNDGLSGNDLTSGILVWNVQFDSPSKLYYQCTSHGSMGGVIHILDKLPEGTVSGSAQIAADISGSFTSLSSSFEQRITSNEGSISSLNSATSSYLLNTTDTLDGDLTVTGKITAQEFHTEFVSASIIFQSGSTKFGDTADDVHSFTGSVNISGSISADNLAGIISSSAQIASDISGSFTSLSSSLEQRISLNEATGSDQEIRLDTAEGSISSLNSATSSYALQADISGAFDNVSSSFEQRITFNESTGSDHEVRIDLLEGSVSSINNATSSYALESNISGAFDSVSQSIAADIEDIIDGTTTVTSASYAVTASYAINAGAGLGFPFSGSAVITGSLYVSQSTISGSFVGDGSGIEGVISSSHAVTASYALNAGGADTGSLLTTASAAGTTITFEKGDGTTFDVSITSDVTPANALVTASIAGSTLIFEKGDTSTFNITLPAGGYSGSNATAHLYQTIAASTWSFAHNLDDRYPVFTVFDENDDIIIPNRVETVNKDNANIYFTTARTGTATAVIASSISQIASVTADFTNQTTVAVTHSLDTRNIHVSVYDTNYSLVVPESITLDTLDTVVVTFPTAQSGTIVVAQGGHIISGSVPWENISNIPAGILSGSEQIASDISGSFTSVSSSIASDIEDIIDGTTTITSSSHALNADDAISSSYSLTSSYAANADLLDGLDSSQFLRNDQSGTLTGDLTVTGIITAQEFHTQLVSASIIYQSGSTKFGDSADDVHSFTGSVNIDGDVTATSYTGIFVGVISSSAQIGSDISGSFTSLSSSLEQRITLNEATGSDQETRLDTLEGKTLISSSAQIASDISGSFTSVSQSIASNITSLISDSGSFSTRITDLESFSSSLDATFATDADLNLVSSSVDSLNAATSSYALKNNISGAFASVSSSIASDIEDIIDGTTTVTSASFALTASFALNAGAGAGFPFSGSAEITGSFLVSGSFVDFTDVTAISGSIFSGSFVGDGTGLTGLGFGDTKKLNQTVAATTWSFNHNMNEQYPTVTVYNDNNEVVQPSKIEAESTSTLNLYFGIPTAGTAVAVVGGVALTQEAGFNRVLSQTAAATTWSFVHNLGQKYPQFEVYDSNDEIIIPGKVEAVDQNNAIFYFDTPQAGTVAATVGGTAMTASYADTLTIIDTLLTTQQNTDVDTGIETVATVSTTNFDGAFFDYVLKDGTNYRAGTVSAVWDGSSVQFSETSTADIGNTNSVTMSVDITGSDARLRASVGSDNWNIKAFVRAL